MGKPSEAVIENLDVLTEILLRLPAKALLTLKCVSKQLLSLVSDHEFCRNHILRHQSPHSVPSALLLSGGYSQFPHFVPLCNPSGNHDNSTFKAPDFEYLDPCGVVVEASCNGLLLCSANYDGQSFRYFVCNPTTKRFIRIPNPNWEIGEDVFQLNLTFDPVKSPNYKVVSLRRSEDYRNMLRIDIYSSETRAWSDPKVSFIPPTGMGIAEGVFCKGAIHWYSVIDYALYFDVDTTYLRSMPMPSCNREIGYFGESRGRLLMIVFDRPKHLEFDVLEMEDDYSGWSVRYHVNFSAMKLSSPNLIKGNMYSIFCVVLGEEEEEEEDSTIVFLVRKTMVSWNLSDRTLKKLQVLENCGMRATNSNGSSGLSSSHLNQSRVFQYFESLACV